MPDTLAPQAEIGNWGPGTFDTTTFATRGTRSVMFVAQAAREARLIRSGGATSPTDWIFRARMACVSSLADCVLAWMAFIRSSGSSMSVANVAAMVATLLVWSLSSARRVGAGG